MSGDLKSFFTRRPLWVTVPVIVVCSVASSVGAMLLLMSVPGQTPGPGFARSLTVAIVASMMVSAPIGGYIIHLLREVESARQRAQMLAWYDDLTGLLNRRRFCELGGREMALMQRGGRRLVAALIDVDDFKRINDCHGHAGGDAVLRTLGATLPGLVRNTDLVARWGGEEFALLLPDAVDAEALAERVRTSLADLRVVVDATTTRAFTVSIGVTEACPGDDFGVLLGRADRALYAAKAAGKNRVVFENCAAAPPSALYPA